MTTLEILEAEIENLHKQYNKAEAKTGKIFRKIVASVNKVEKIQKDHPLVKMLKGSLK